MSFAQKHLAFASLVVVAVGVWGCGVVPDGTEPQQRIDAGITTVAEAGMSGNGGAGGTAGSASAGTGGVGGQMVDASPPDGGMDRTPPADAGPPAGWVGPPLVVAVGYGGRRLVSTDGVVWMGDMQDVRGNGDNPRLLRDVAYGNGLVVAVGGGCMGMACSGRIVTFNGDRWTEAMVPAGQGWLGGVAHGGGVWVAVGAGGSVLSSADGKTWTSARPHTGNLRRVAYGNVGGTNMFVAVGDDALRLRSLDGKSWTDPATGFPGTDSPVSLAAVAIGNGTAVAAGDAGRRIRSRDGVKWIDPWAGGQGIGAVVFADGKLMAFDDPVVHLSFDDGTSWSPQMQVNPPGDSVAAGMLRGTRLFVGARGAEIKTSSNGVAWTTRVNGGADLNNIAAFTFAGF